MNNWFRFNLPALFCVLAISFPAFAEQATVEMSGSSVEDAVGIVKTARGSVMVERGSGIQVLSVGSRVYQDDRIFTGALSSVGVTFKDDMRISLGASSSFRITRFAYNPSTQEGSFLGTVLKGSLRFVTGLLGKVKPESVAVYTPSTTIGIRGTDFIVTVEELKEVPHAK
ncbi:MAG TPA: FecR domain-containing protein [Gallionella sp.]